MWFAKFLFRHQHVETVCMSSGSMFSFFIRRVQRRIARLAVSGQPFANGHGPSREILKKGIELFQYLKGYVDLGIIAAHDNMEQLHGEIRAMNTGETHLIAFYGPMEYGQLQASHAFNLGTSVMEYQWV